MKRNREPFCTGCAIGAGVVAFLAVVGFVHIALSIVEAMPK